MTGQFLDDDGRLDVQHLFGGHVAAPGDRGRLHAGRGVTAGGRRGGRGGRRDGRDRRHGGAGSGLRGPGGALGNQVHDRGLGRGAATAGRTTGAGAGAGAAGGAFLPMVGNARMGAAFLTGAGFSSLMSETVTGFSTGGLGAGGGAAGAGSGALRRSWRRISTWTNGSLPHPCGQRRPHRRKRDACRRTNLWRWREGWA